MLPLFLANVKMLVRNRAALFWAMVFPVMFIVVFGLFDMESMGSAKVAVVDRASTPLSQQLVEGLKKVDFLKIDQRFADEAAARQALQDGDIDFVLIVPEALRGVAPGVAFGQSGAELTLLYAEANIRQNQVVEGILRQFVNEVNLQVAGGTRSLSLKGQGLSARRIGYFDFLVPGIMGMGIMTFSIIFIASGITQYRQQKILKRMLATPLKVYKFFVAQVLAHLLLSLVQSAIILAVALLFFHGHIYGSYLWLFVLVLVGNIVFLNIGFIVAGLAKSVNAANGLANVIAMPMMFFSGTFFSTETLPPVMRNVVEYLPLTPLLDAMRKVALDAEPLWGPGRELALLGGWVVVTSVLAVRLFKFE